MSGKVIVHAYGNADPARDDVFSRRKASSPPGCLCRFLPMIWLMATVSLSYGAELVNPSFDIPKPDPLRRFDEAKGWARWGSWANRHDDQPTCRSRNGRGLLVYHHWESDTENAGWFQVVTNVVAGNKYEFQLYALWEPNCNADGIELRIESLSGDKVFGARTYTAKKTGKRWKRLSVKGQIEKGVAEIRCVIQCNHCPFARNAEGSILFDDARLRNLSPRGAAARRRRAQ